MKAILNKLYEHQSLSEQEAFDILIRIGKGEFNHSQIASFLTVFLMRKLEVEELIGFKNALLELCIKVDFEGLDTIDVCGTGGDGRNTFNISTLSAFVVAGAGYKVAKHGNYGVSSSVGSSNVLEYLGYHFTNDEGILKKQIEKTNFCMLHAPLFHPAMKNVAPVRKELAVKTFFNLLGPLVNPSFPRFQFVGVFNMEVLRLYNYLFQQTEKKFSIIHSVDGYDEISLTSNFKIINNLGERLYSPRDLNLQCIKQHDIYGGNSIKESARIFLNVLENKCTNPQKNTVLVNSAFTIQCIDEKLDFNASYEKAKESLYSGKAYQTLLKVIKS